ncbi:MAG: DUF3794 domain-containing protein [Maledivibacter sp.]|jgi:hypothetical protein|nr:DUF3794 domain-containing protein [Maledivibacter sp.]
MSACPSNNLIEYVGVANNLPDTVTNFSEFVNEEILIIPKQKPNIEQITRVSSNVKIVSTNAVKNVSNSAGPFGSSVPGFLTTGWVLTVEGAICEVITYVADDPTQSLHSAHFVKPFSTILALPSDFDPTSTITVTPFIENICIEQIDCRRMFKCELILINATGIQTLT